MWVEECEMMDSKGSSKLDEPKAVTVPHEKITPEPKDTNPHSLWKQILGLGIGSIIFFFVGGIFVVLSGIFTFVDAWKAGIYKKKDVKSFFNLSPVAWGIAMEALLIIVYPIYLIKRNKLRTKDGENVFWISTIIFGAIALLFGVYQIISRIGSVQPL